VESTTTSGFKNQFKEGSRKRGHPDEEQFVCEAELGLLKERGYRVETKWVKCERKGRDNYWGRRVASFNQVVMSPGCMKWVQKQLTQK